MDEVDHRQVASARSRLRPTRSRTTSASNFCDGVDGLRRDGRPRRRRAPQRQCVSLPPPGPCSRRRRRPPRDRQAGRRSARDQRVPRESRRAPAPMPRRSGSRSRTRAPTAFDLNELGLKGNDATTTVIRPRTASRSRPVASRCSRTRPIPRERHAAGGRRDVHVRARDSSGSSIRSSTARPCSTRSRGPRRRPADGISRQLNPANTNATDNDNPANFCTGTAAQMYGDRGKLRHAQGGQRLSVRPCSRARGRCRQRVRQQWLRVRAELRASSSA